MIEDPYRWSALLRVLVRIPDARLSRPQRPRRTTDPGFTSLGGSFRLPTTDAAVSEQSEQDQGKQVTAVARESP
jgi:hypothetical protein